VRCFSKEQTWFPGSKRGGTARSWYRQARRISLLTLG